MKFRFLPAADRDLDRLYAFLAEQNLEAAHRAMLAIDNALNLLTQNPKLGLLVRKDREDRQLLIPFGNSAYVIRYRLDEARDTLFVVRVWHGREQRL